MFYTPDFCKRGIDVCFFFANEFAALSFRYLVSFKTNKLSQIVDGTWWWSFDFYLSFRDCETQVVRFSPSLSD